VDDYYFIAYIISFIYVPVLIKVDVIKYIYKSVVLIKVKIMTKMTKVCGSFTMMCVVHMIITSIIANMVKVRYY